MLFKTKLRFWTRFVRVCDETTTGHIQYWDKIDLVWVIKLDSGTHGLSNWNDDEPKAID